MITFQSDAFPLIPRRLGLSLLVLAATAVVTLGSVDEGLSSAGLIPSLPFLQTLPKHSSYTASVSVTTADLGKLGKKLKQQPENGRKNLRSATMKNVRRERRGATTTTTSSSLYRGKQINRTLKRKHKRHHHNKLIQTRQQEDPLMPEMEPLTEDPTATPPPQEGEGESFLQEAGETYEEYSSSSGATADPMMVAMAEHQPGVAKVSKKMAGYAKVGKKKKGPSPSYDDSEDGYLYTYNYEEYSSKTSKSKSASKSASKASKYGYLKGAPGGSSKSRSKASKASKSRKSKKGMKLHHKHDGGLRYFEATVLLEMEDSGYTDLSPTLLYHLESTVLRTYNDLSVTQCDALGRELVAVTAEPTPSFTGFILHMQGACQGCDPSRVPVFARAADGVFDDMMGGVPPGDMVSTQPPGFGQVDPEPNRTQPPDVITPDNSNATTNATDTELPPPPMTSEDDTTTPPIIMGGTTTVGGNATADGGATTPPAVVNDTATTVPNGTETTDNTARNRNPLINQDLLQKKPRTFSKFRSRLQRSQDEQEQKGEEVEEEVYDSKYPYFVHAGNTNPDGEEEEGSYYQKKPDYGAAAAATATDRNAGGRRNLGQPNVNRGPAADVQQDPNVNRGPQVGVTMGGEDRGYDDDDYFYDYPVMDVPLQKKSKDAKASPEYPHYEDHDDNGSYSSGSSSSSKSSSKSKKSKGVKGYYYHPQLAPHCPTVNATHRAPTEEEFVLALNHETDSLFAGSDWNPLAVRSAVQVNALTCASETENFESTLVIQFTSTTTAPQSSLLPDEIALMEATILNAYNHLQATTSCDLPVFREMTELILQGIAEGPTDPVFGPTHLAMFTARGLCRGQGCSNETTTFFDEDEIRQRHGRDLGSHLGIGQFETLMSSHYDPYGQAYEHYVAVSQCYCPSKVQEFGPPFLDDMQTVLEGAVYEAVTQGQLPNVIALLDIMEMAGTVGPQPGSTPNTTTAPIVDFDQTAPPTTSTGASTLESFIIIQFFGVRDAVLEEEVAAIQESIPMVFRNLQENSFCDANARSISTATLQTVDPGPTEDSFFAWLCLVGKLWYGGLQRHVFRRGRSGLCPMSRR
jgi:hypothetical protein